MSVINPDQVVLPGWLADGKGIRGNAQPVFKQGFSFPPAQVSRVEPQLPLTNPPLALPTGGVSPELLPFQFFDASDQTGARIGINYGEIRWGTETSGTPPDGMTEGTPFGLGVSGTGYVWAHIVIDSSDRSCSDRELDEGDTIPDDSDTDLYVPLGSVTVDDQALTFRNYRTGDLFLREYYVTVNGSLYRDYYEVVARNPVEVPPS